MTVISSTCIVPATYRLSLLSVYLSHLPTHSALHPLVDPSIDLHYLIYLPVYFFANLPCQQNFMSTIGHLHFGLEVLRTWSSTSLRKSLNLPAQLCQAICTVHKIDIEPIHANSLWIWISDDATNRYMYSVFVYTYLYCVILCYIILYYTIL